jgi:hypothetical protein
MARYGASLRLFLSCLTIILLLGPLRPALAQDDLPQAEALFPATLQGMERESTSGAQYRWGAIPMHSTTASYLDASTDAEAVVDLIVPDASFASLYPPEVHSNQKLIRRLASSNPDDLEAITVASQTAYLAPEDSEGGLVAYVPLGQHALLKVRQCCGKAEQDLRALIAALDTQRFRSAATAYAEAEHNAELRSLLMAVPPSIGEYPLGPHDVHAESGSYVAKLSYPTTENARDKIEITMLVSVSAVPTEAIMMELVPPDQLERGLAEGWITQTTLSGHAAYLMDTEDYAGVFVTDGAHAIFAARGPATFISSEAVLEDLTEARIDTFFAGVKAIVAK